MFESRIRILALFAHYTDKLAYFDDWLDAFSQYRGFDVVPLDIVPRESRKALNNVIGQVDAVVLLHSTNGDGTFYLEPHVGTLADRRVPMLSFVGNEVNLPGASISGKRRLLEAIKPEWIATQLPLEAGQYLFGDVAARGVVALPHALNPTTFRPVVPQDRRPIDIGSRVSRYIPHLGDDDRNRIADTLASAARERALVVDISFDRVNRAEWAAFLSRCKGTVSTESGSWYLERDDRTVEAMREFIREREAGIMVAPDSKLVKLARQLPPWTRPAAKWVTRLLGFRSESAINEAWSHADIHARFFEGKPRAPVYSKAISSRHFEAIGCKTCQIMFVGRFNDILEAGKHYIGLDHDFGNIDDAFALFADPGRRAAIVEEAFSHVMARHTYEHRMRQIYELLAGSQRG